MSTAYIGIGSNLGDRLRNCRVAVEALGRLPDTHLRAVSPSYETEPEDGAGPRWFINAVAAVETRLTPEALLAALQDVEALAGRPAERAPGSDRAMDLDLLLYDDLVLDGPSLTLPHPRMHRRRFVLEPLCAVARDALHPLLGRPVRDLLAALGPGPAVRPLGEQPVLHAGAKRSGGGSRGGA